MSRRRAMNVAIALVVNGPVGGALGAAPPPGAPVAAAEAPEETNAVVDGDLGVELDAMLTRCVAWGFSGSVLVSRNDRVILRKGYGLADRERGVPNTPDTLFEIASVSKHFTAVAVLHLEEAGRLSTDDAISDWLPGVPDEHAGVTIYHLLTNTSGFPRMGPTGSGDNAGAAMRRYLSGGRVREPGTGFEYWNGGYALLAMIVERAGEQPFEAYLREHLFGPAGMGSTGFCREATLDEIRLARGYVEGEDVGSAADHSFGWEYRGMGGVVTSVADLDRWDRALRAGRILHSTEKLETPFLSGYACGGWVEQTPRETRRIMLGGNVAGFNSSVWRMPDDRAMVAVLCNTTHDALIVGMHLDRRLFDEPGILSAPPKAVALDEAVLAAVGGSYRSADGSRLEMRAEDGSVHVEVEGQPGVQMFLYGNPEVPEGVQETIEKARAVLEGVNEDNYGPLRAAMADSIPDDWPQRFRPYWQSHIADHGEVKSIELVGARPTAMSPSSLKVLFRLQHEGGQSLAELRLDAGQLQIFTLEPEAPLVDRRYMPTSRSRLESYSLGPTSPAVIEFDAERGALVVIGSSGAKLEFNKECAVSDPATP